LLRHDVEEYPIEDLVQSATIKGDCQELSTIVAGAIARGKGGFRGAQYIHDRNKIAMTAQNFPRVGSLRYTLRVPAQYGFVETVTDSGTIGPFAYSLRYHSAEFVPLEDFETVNSARAELEPLLQAWQVSALLC
jgi:hypothetical protein